MRQLIITLLSIMLLGATLDDAREANKAYNEGNYEEAISLYERAIESNPEDPKLYFNLASAHAQAGNTDEAIGLFEEYKAMAEDPTARALADYNIGNIYSGEESWDKAVDHYRESLRFMSDDADAKHNYELALKKKQEQEQEDQEQQQQGEDQQEQDQQNRDQQENNQQDQQQNQEQNQQQNESDQQRQNQQRQQQQITPEEAEKILKALGEQEKDLLKQFRKQKTESSDTKNEKDW